jgi:hypothetical protein
MMQKSLRSALLVLLLILAALQPLQGEQGGLQVTSRPVQHVWCPEPSAFVVLPPALPPADISPTIMCPHLIVSPYAGGE